MSKFTSHDYTTQTGKTLSVVTLADILKAAGLPVEGATCFRGGSGTKLAGQFVVNWLAPKAAGTVKDEKASNGAAGPAVSMQDMMAMLQQMMAAQGAASVAAVPVAAVPVKRTGRKAG